MARDCATSIPACGSVSFLRVAGEGWDGGQRAEEVVCPPPRSSPINGGGRRCNMSELYQHVAASPSPASRGKAGMGDSAQMSRLSPPQSSPIHGGGRRCNMPAQYPHAAASPSPAVRGKAGMGDSAQRKSFVPHLNPPPYIGEEDAAICPLFTCMWQRLLPPRRGGRPGWGTARTFQIYAHLPNLT